MVPSIISHYEILEKLGEGSVGVVYKARDTLLGRTVALKFLQGHLTDVESEKDRLLKEAQAAAILNHQNICTVYGIEEHDGETFISMEYIGGGTIRQKFPYPSPGEAVRAALQIGEALQEAHARGIVHRDIKPENIMFTSKGQIKVMDFGLAKLRGAMKQTPSTGAFGTPAYASPELIQGGDVDSRSDIFSFGVLLYEMLAGRLPFRGEHEASVMYSIVNEDPPPLSAVRADVPEQLERIILRALEKDVNRRYQDVGAMLGHLKEVRTGHLPSSQPLLAVLPFDNISPDKENDYFSEGLTEEIIASLSQLGGLKVISRTSVMRYKGIDKNLKQIAKELNATFVLEGGVRKSGKQLRITTQLIDAVQDTSLWAETFRGSIDDIFDIQEKVAGQIVRALKVRLTPDEKNTLRKRLTGDSEAYQLYLQGRHFWNKRTEAGLKAAIRYFEKAIERDPRYPLAWAGIADSYNLLATDGSAYRKELYHKAKVAVTRALEIDDRLAEAHASLAMILMLDEWDWAGSEREYRLSISLRPQYATAHHWYSELLMCIGRFETALSEISEAIELDPTSPAIYKDKGLVHYYSRQYDSAIEMSRKALELDSTFVPAHRVLSLAFQGKRMFPEALEEHGEWQRSSALEMETTLALAQLYAVSGRGEEAREICRRLESNLSPDALVFRPMALVYAALNENDRAFHWLERGYERKDDSLCTLKVDPKMDNLRSDPRFDGLVKRIGLE